MDEGQGRSARRGVVACITFLAAIWALVLAGCSGSASSGATPLVVTSVHVVLTGDLAVHHISPLDQTVTDATKVQHLYNVMQALPPFPQGVVHCPEDLGVLYHLTFYRDGVEMSRASVNPYGCQEVILPTGDARTSANVEYFWQVFAGALGVTEADLPHMRFDTSAPTATPGQP